MMRTVQEQFRMPDGIHTGKIEKIEERIAQEKYHYVDVVISCNNGTADGEVKVSYPDCVSANSKFGLLLQRFNMPLTPNAEVNVDAILLGKECQFQTLNQVRGEKSFTKVLDETVKPKVAAEDLVTSPDSTEFRREQPTPTG